MLSKEINSIATHVSVCLRLHMLLSDVSPYAQSFTSRCVAMFQACACAAVLLYIGVIGQFTKGVSDGVSDGAVSVGRGGASPRPSDADKRM